MKTSDIKDVVFKQAVNMLDEGRLDALRQLIEHHPYLVQRRLDTPDQDGYFKDPYLMWFIADNPIRNEKLPENVLNMLSFLIDAVKREAPDTFKQQLDYTLALVATGGTPRESGRQIAMIDLLIDAGATPGGGIGAIANGNIEAANRLIDRGGKLTLAVAMILERKADIEMLMSDASENDKLTALTAVAFYGKANMVKYLLDYGVDPNGYPDSRSDFHSHASPLHQAVSSGSINVVRTLIEAGSRLDVTDKVYNSTPLGWAIYMQTETNDENKKTAYREIENYLLTVSG